MRAVIWLVLLFVVAVVAATTLGSNDGLVSFYWAGRRARPVAEPVPARCWRPPASCWSRCSTRVQRADRPAAARARVARGAARPHRAGRAARGAGAVLRRPLQPRAQGGAARAGDPGRHARAGAGQRVHRARPPAGRRQPAPPAGPRRPRPGARSARSSWRATAPPRASADEGARLLAAEWALDDRDAARALELLAELPPGVARRTQALRLKLQATRLGQQPQEALKTARLLAKHQGFSKAAAQGLLRSLAFESLDTRARCRPAAPRLAAARRADRRDPFVAARAATLRRRASARATRRAAGCARSGTGWPSCRPRNARRSRWRWLAAIDGLGVDWLPRLEAAAQAYPRERRDGLRGRHGAGRAPAVGQGAPPAGAGGRRRQLARAARRQAWLHAGAHRGRAGRRRARRTLPTRRPPRLD